MSKAIVFRRKLGFPLPHGGVAGHVAWAFEIVGEGFYCGSTENPDARPWSPAGEDNGWWARLVPTETEVLSAMRSRLYVDCKYAEIARGDSSKARAVADNCRLVGYSFSGNNCLDHCFQILLHYGAIDLPLPLMIGLPNGWFSAIAWEWASLADL